MGFVVLTGTSASRAEGLMKGNFYFPNGKHISKTDCKTDLMSCAEFTGHQQQQQKNNQDCIPVEQDTSRCDIKHSGDHAQV